MQTDLVDVVLLAECVEHDVDLIEHVHHLHGCDVDADLVELDHIAEEDRHIREDLGHEGSRHRGPFALCESTFYMLDAAAAACIYLLLALRPACFYRRLNTDITHCFLVGCWSLEFGIAMLF